MADGTPVRIDGRDALAESDDHTLVLRIDGADDVTVPYARVAGMRATPAAVTLFLVDGRTIEIERAPASPGDALARLAAAVSRGAFALPELMRGLRAFGSPRALPGSDHDRFFAPLVSPLRALRAEHEAARARGMPWRAAEIVDATSAGADVRATIAALASERFPQSQPDRRALEAELLDEAEELLAALDALTGAAQRLGVAPDRERAGEWRAWCGAFSRALEAADRCWARSLPALADSRGAEGRLWRRVLRREG